MRWGPAPSDWDGGGGVSGNWNEYSRGLLLSSMTLEFTFRVLMENFATEQTNRERVNCRPANASKIVDECEQRYTLQSNTFSGATFGAIFIGICFAN